MGERCLRIEEALAQASDMSGELENLLKQLEKVKAQLAGHKPYRVQPGHLKRQIKELTVCCDCMHACSIHAYVSDKYIATIGVLCTLCMQCI